MQLAFLLFDVVKDHLSEGVCVGKCFLPILLASKNRFSLNMTDL